MKKFTYASLLAGAAMFFGAPFAYAATNDYTNYWTFDEGRGLVAADSAGGQNGSLTATSTGFGFASGQVGKAALGMDGATGESVALPDGFLSGSQGSIVLWLKVNNLSDRNIYFSARSTIDNYIYAALMIDHEGRPQFQFRTTAGGNDQRVQGSKILNRNEWYQLVFTSNGQTYQMFVNGEAASVAGNNIGRWIPELTNQTFSYHIGSIETNVLNGVFDGYIDDLRIYNRALTQDDVTALYNGGVPVQPVVTVAPSTPASTEVTLTAPASVTPPATVPVVTPPLTIALPQTPEKTAVISITRNLSVGSRGDDVRTLQLLLIKKGYLASQYATGYFGMLTKTAAIQLQKEFALPQTGFVGPMTRAKLNAAQ